jgi:hypothetical protein
MRHSGAHASSLRARPAAGRTAVFAGVSLDYYARLEQGSLPQSIVTYGNLTTHAASGGGYCAVTQFGDHNGVTWAIQSVICLPTTRSRRYGRSTS